MKTQTSHNISQGVGIISTANPDGSYIKHSATFDPTGKAIERKGMFIIPITNQVRKGGICHENEQEQTLQVFKEVLEGEV